MKKACVFDLDGTLLYTLESIAFAGNAALALLGYPPEPEEAYAYYCGEGADVLVRRILEKNGDTEPSHFEKAVAMHRKTIHENASLGVRPYAGIPEALKALKAKGLKLAVCSNKPDNATREGIREMFGEDVFDVVMGQKDPLKRKPWPDMPLAICDTLGVTPSECLYFGDTGTDMQTARAAGMTGIGVLWGYRTKEELMENGAVRLIADPSEIPGLTGEDW
ncbi:MAG: HAD-IA family hydrolase [Lachnospiraceae bacterium]|nr:HAD-IA family hydrolase [Lachnospiraceae bacterium]